jgi:single-strand DNA-binding protein
MATNRSWVPTDGGERQEETEFHRIVAWAKLGEICSQLLYKGRKVFVEGRLQTRKWTGQDGQERETTEVVIDNMIALGAPKGRSGYGEDMGDFQDDTYQQDTGDDTVVDSAMDDEVQADETAPKASRSKPARKNKQDEEEAVDVDVDDIPF